MKNLDSIRKLEYLFITGLLAISCADQAPKQQPDISQGTASEPEKAVDQSIQNEKDKVATWKPSTAQEQAVAKAVDKFWKSVQYNDWQGIIALYSNQSMDQYYEDVVGQIRPLLDYSIPDINAFIETATDPYQKTLAEFTLLYKTKQFKALKYRCRRNLAEMEFLSKFQGGVVTRYQIVDMEISNNGAEVRESYWVKRPGANPEVEVKITQRFSYLEKKWVFK